MVPADLSIAAIFGAALPSVRQVSRFDAPTQRFEHFVSNQPTFSQFDTLEPGRGYAVELTQPLTLTLSGPPPPAGTTRSLAPGSNLIGNPTGASLTVEALLSPLQLGLDISNVWRYTGSGFAALSQSDQVAAGEAVFVSAVGSRTWPLPQPPPQRTQFTYDGDGGRVTQTTSAGTTT